MVCKDINTYTRQMDGCKDGTCTLWWLGEKHSCTIPIFIMHYYQHASVFISAGLWLSPAWRHNVFQLSGCPVLLNEIAQEGHEGIPGNFVPNVLHGLKDELWDKWQSS